MFFSCPLIRNDFERATLGETFQGQKTASFVVVLSGWMNFFDLKMNLASP